jgi:hypothetical protein
MAGVPIAFKFQQMRIRREIKSQIKTGLSRDQLHELSFSMAENAKLQWTEKNKEFRFNGEMFDVVSSETRGDTIYYYCINDKDEASLFANLGELVKKKLDDDCNSGKNISAKLIRAITSLVFLPSELNPFIISTREPLNYFTSHSIVFLSPFLELVTPPPKQA